MCPAGQGQGSWDTKPTWRTESGVYTLICCFSRLGTGRWQPEAEEACCFLSITELCNDGTSRFHRPPVCDKAVPSLVGVTQVDFQPW